MRAFITHDTTLLLWKARDLDNYNYIILLLLLLDVFSIC